MGVLTTLLERRLHVLTHQVQVQFTLQVQVQFTQSLSDDEEDVVLETYILAYEEINKIFGVLGSVCTYKYTFMPLCKIFGVLGSVCTYKSCLPKIK